MDIAGFAILVGSLVPAILALPGFIGARRKKHASIVDYFAVPIAGLIWFLLAFSGVGSQSLSNIIEILAIPLVMIVLYYGALSLPPEGSSIKPRTVSIMLWGIAIGLPVCLRLFMPELPE